jgi:hypothetical protein
MSENIPCLGDHLTRREFLTITEVSLGAAIVASSVGFMGCARNRSEDVHRNEVVHYQKLSRPKIEELLGVENYDLCRTAMLRKYDQFAPRLPLIRGKRNRNTFYASAPFMLSLYRALLDEFAFRQDKALDILDKITSFKVRKDWENRTITRIVMSHAAGSKFFRDLTLKGFRWEGEEKYGWTAEFPKSDAYIAVNITRCGLVKWFREQGAPEIAPIACKGDFVWAEFMTGLKLVRTKTLAEGYDICDFRYVKT